jgi:hypothetical protein
MAGQSAPTRELTDNPRHDVPVGSAAGAPGSVHANGRATASA